MTKTHSCYFLALFIFSIMGQLFFMAYLPPHLDELYYVDWTNYLDLGYIEHPPLLSYFVALFKACFGKSIFVLRFVSFLAYLSSILMFYFLFGRNVLYALSQITVFLLFYSTTLVTENLFYALILWSLYFYQRAFIQNRLKDFVFAGILMGFAILTNLMGGLFSIGLCFVWVFYRKRIDVRYLLISFIFAGLILSSYLYWVISHFNFWFEHLVRLTGRNNTWYLFRNFIAIEFLFTPLTLTVGVYVFCVWFLRFLKARGRFLDEELNRAEVFFSLLATPIFFYYVYKIISSKMEFYWVAPIVLLLNILIAFFLKKNKFSELIVGVSLSYATIVFIIFYGFIAIGNKSFALNSGFVSNYYVMGQFFDPDFKRFYDEKMDKELPFVARGYQIPAVINYYLEPKTQARTLPSKLYHQTIYSFNYKDSQTLENGMYYVTYSFDEDFEEIRSFYGKIEEIPYPTSLSKKKNSPLWSFPRIFKMTDFLPEKKEEMLQFVHKIGGR